MCPTGFIVLKFQTVTCPGSNFIKRLQKVPFSRHYFVELENDAKLNKKNENKTELICKRLKYQKQMKTKWLQLLTLFFIEYSYNN